MATGFKQQYPVIAAVSQRLHMRHHLRFICPRTCTLPELSETELIVLCVARFLTNIYVNGWDGYLSNTENEFGDFLVVALEAIGAHDMAALAYEALQQEDLLASLGQEEVARRGLKHPNDHPFFECRDDLAALLFTFWKSHQNELPSAEPISPQEANEYELERECLATPELRSWPRFRCPHCQKRYISEKDRGECPECGIHRRLHERH